MLDFSLSDFIQERTEALPENSLILISENAFHIANDRIVFTPSLVAVNTAEGGFVIPNATIPIRKVEKDQTMEEVLESVIIKRPNNDYINVNDISRSISWWIVNNAEALKYPSEVVIEYFGIDNEKRAILCERTGKKKWEVVAAYDPENEIVVENDKSNQMVDSAKQTYVNIMKEMWG